MDSPGEGRLISVPCLKVHDLTDGINLGLVLRLVSSFFYVNSDRYDQATRFDTDISLGFQYATRPPRTRGGGRSQTFVLLVSNNQYNLGGLNGIKQ
tara:strand:- start:13096 stop:13383 length:288 start_codon:yes stop_codon:yes gene_type:complete